MDNKEYQIRIEQTCSCLLRNEKRRITKDDLKNGHKVGDIISVRRYGTFGCWDENYKWVDFYNSETVK